PGLARCVHARLCPGRRVAGDGLARARDDLRLRPGGGHRLPPHRRAELDRPPAAARRAARRARGPVARRPHGAPFCQCWTGGAALIALIAREVASARNFHNYPIVAVLGVLFAGNVLVHLQALGLAYTAALGNRIGVATLLALIALIGGRIIPSFTRNWLARNRPEVAEPAPHSKLDWICLALTVLGVGAWAAAPDADVTHALELLGGTAAALRLSRWKGLSAAREPLVFVLHMGYAWLALGLL